jgi:adenylate kinase
MAGIIITGTPGTGKTTISKIVANKLKYPLIAVNDLIIEKHLYNGHDKQKGYKVVDMHKLSKEIEVVVNHSSEKIIIEGHLAHNFGIDELVEIVIVLRARPQVLRERLNKREWTDSKVQENIESEALDICTFEAVEIHGKKVNELDTSNLTAEQVAGIIIEILDGKKQFPPGKINFLDDMYG